MENKKFEIIIKKDGEVLHQAMSDCVYAAWDEGDRNSAAELASCDALTLARLLNTLKSLVNARLEKEPKLKIVMALLQKLDEDEDEE